MLNWLRVMAYAVVGLLIGVGVENALAAEITQSELGSPGTTACVEVLISSITSNTPVLASDCGDRFGSYWHWDTSGVISGNGSTTFVSTCLKAKNDARVVVFDCKPSVPGPGEIWFFFNGEVRLNNGPLAGRCLDSRGFYGTTRAAQLVVEACTGSPTQQWTIK